MWKGREKTKVGRREGSERKTKGESLKKQSGRESERKTRRGR